MGKVSVSMVVATFLMVMLAGAAARNDFLINLDEDSKCCQDHHMPNCEDSQCINFCSPCRDYTSSRCKILGGHHYCHCKC
ncbi:hypothetical protein H6P81_003147 [Aristolochia fimbriata]|uniref:Uncharacterized protein n=1 Tax=Aristolochia fimbriata TaxID=158543 RepID=A0AAV7E2Q6_ARIFI|nr:hypothetical protein H6P81_017966 [Aristolochia fimbriata]KAG9442113.1 hypothetical protein H6P81_017967 [Aristolochia fimbriata]KAG9458639.1 hypothetical protein H6P81_003147 [Aristolochia fimbriata]